MHCFICRMISNTSDNMGVVFVIICMMKMFFAQSADDVVRLRRHLFENTSYDSSVRPAVNQSSLTEV